MLASLRILMAAGARLSFEPIDIGEGVYLGGNSYANVRPCAAYAPFVATRHPGMDVVIVRCAFEYARAHGRRKVTCLTKDNIMKLTDGLFHRVFDRMAADHRGLDPHRRHP